VCLFLDEPGWLGAGGNTTFKKRTLASLSGQGFTMKKPGENQQGIGNSGSGLQSKQAVWYLLLLEDSEAHTEGCCQISRCY